MKWYYKEHGKIAGLAAREDIAKLIERNDAGPIVIWAEDEAPGEPPGLSIEPETKKSQSEGRETLGARMRNELVEYLAIVVYLAVCFGALLFYKATILESAGVETARVGIAIIKALILGKFVLILESLKVGKGKKPARILALGIVKKATLFTLLLIVLNAIEEAAVGFIHGEEPTAALKEMGGGARPEALATALLMFLVLIPYFAFRDIAASLGEETLLRLLFTRQPVRLNADPCSAAAERTPEASSP